jgi:F-type H+-transporting ATPase subunit b
VLAERRKRTTGAMEQARGAISAAEAETAVFEDKLRAARTELFNARDQRLKKLAAERDAVLGEARAATQAKVQAARVSLEQGAAAARQQIESLSGELSAQILKAVLPAGVAGSEAAQ